MRILFQYLTNSTGYLSSIDIRRLLPIVSVILLLFLSYKFRQCQYIYSKTGRSVSKTVNQTINVTLPLTKLIVVSHYNEDLDWLELFIGDKIPHIVYTRSTNSLTLRGLRVNKGREAVAYLQYIVDHYSNLPSLIAFIHGHRTAWHQTDPADMAVALRALQWNKYTYMPLTSTMTHTIFQNEFPDIQYRVNYQMWRDVLQKELGRAPINGIKAHCCATFVVKREAILKHPKEFYSNISDYMIASSYSDHLTARTMEYTWHLLFGQPAAIQFNKCDLFVCDKNGEISVELAEKNSKNK